METLILMVPIGVVLSLFAFFYFEKRALKANKNSAIASGEIPVYSINEKFKQYDTMNNTGLFAVVAYVLTLALSLVFYESSYGLIHALVYIFLTTFVGSGVIFVLKASKSLLIKVFATFLYGIGHIVGASFAFLTSFVLS